MSLNHAVIWIDHQEAHVMFLSEDADEAEIIKTKSTHPHLHHKSGTIGSGRAPFDVKYFQVVTEAVKNAKEILILGPGSAKVELTKYAHLHHLEVAARIVGIETVNHPTDKQILAFAKKFYYKIDRILGDPSL